ncbi:hypothetical protein [Aeromonas veronii]|uniref:hypothetical protein n=1 Tax=Aeromonas veronii TaxID=654 RepID=UPI000D339540|nr:hypothetical protein [Aeromonas veronii]MBS4705151.1 hypothetical protein [Aeromonas veronii]QWL60626.1 hypothetical protein HQ400_21380 [Aeromonas jandaei]
MESKIEKMAHRYADEVIDGNPALFDCIEIQGVSNVDGEGPSGICEVDNDDPDFFSVYLHQVEGGVACVGDFSELADAEAYADELGAKYGWVVQNFAAKK